MKIKKRSYFQPTPGKGLAIAVLSLGLLFLPLLALPQSGSEQAKQENSRNSSPWLETPFTLNLKNASLSEALQELAKVSGKDIAYSDNLLDPNRSITESWLQIPFREILQDILQGSDLDFKTRRNRVILIKAKPKVFTLSGHLIDKLTKEALVGAAVFDPNTNHGVLTNEYGFFSIELPRGPHKLEFRYVGYEKRTEELDLKKNNRKNWELEPNFSLQEVVIVPDRVQETIAVTEPGSPSIITKGFITNTPTLAGEEDLVRASHLLPGIQGGIDGIAGLYIRGGDPGHNLMLMDGVPVFIPFHLLGTYSVYNENTVSAARLIKGGFSARYGGRLAGIYDVRTKEGNLQDWHASATVNLMSGKAIVEGPFSPGKGSIMVAGRWSPIPSVMGEVFDRTWFEADIPGGTLETKFHDINAKINYTISPRDRLYLSFFNGGDEFGKEWEDVEYVNEEDEQEVELYWGNTTGSLRWAHTFGEKLFSNTTVTYSQFWYKYSTYNQFTTNDSLQPIDFFFIDSRSDNQHLGFKTDVDWFPVPKHHLRFGTGLAAPRFSPNFLYLTEESDEVANLDSITPETVNNLVESEVTEVLEGHIYLEDQYTIHPTLKATLGLRGSMFINDGKAYANAEPRLSLNYRPTEKTHLYASGSRMVQYLHLISNTAIRFPNDIWVPANENIRPQTAWMLEFGVDRQLSPHLRISLEGYYRSMNDLYTLPDSLDFMQSGELSGTSSFLVNGDGQAYGLEAMLVFTKGKTSGFINYSLSKTVRQFDSLNLGLAFPHAYDRRHQLKLFATQKIGKGFQVSLNWLYLSGNPRLALATAQSGLGLTSQDLNPPGQKNQLRSNPYHRLDLNLRYSFETWKLRHQVKIGVYNLYNRKNIEYYRETASGNTEAVRGVPVTPSAAYSIQF